MRDIPGQKSEKQSISFMGPDLEFIADKAQRAGVSLSAIVRNYIRSDPEYRAFAQQPSVNPTTESTN